ncbi:Protein of unknwon function [Acidaminococcus fermentans]|uniref:DUF3310 domain-containing protein n=1 Tax=Acidaminococcus fermentans TaxID=905 RepID=UPI0008E9F04E|nr:Protein of unknwon function [Acidaminococcus fermentans]
MNPCEQCELSYRHGGTDGAWMCRGVSPAEPADNFNHEACEAFRKEYKKEKIFIELYQTGKNVIDHPDHYCWKGEECITLIRIMCRGEEGFDGYCKGNVVKYLFREKKKNGIEDLKKARAYLDLLINYSTGKKAANES